MEISFKQTIFSMDPKNKRCIDCGDSNVTYVSVNNGITICDLCAQIHFQLGKQISVVRKINEEFDDYSMNFFIYGGNKNFKKTLKKLGVDLDMQRTKLYRTAGVDYYRKCLLSKVKGKENTEKSPENPNELIEIEIDNDKIDKITVNKKEEKKSEDNEENDDKNINNFLNINNNLGNKTNIGEEDEDNGESHIQLNYQNNNNVDNINNIILVNNKFSKENKTKKGLLRSSLNKIKNIGGYIRKNSTKGIVAMKKAGNIIIKKSKPAADKIKTTAKYVGDHMPYFHKHKFKSQEDIRNNNFDIDIKKDEDIKHEKKEDGNQIEF